MSTKEFLLSLARGARGKEAAKALILPQIFGGLGKVNAGKEYEISGTPPLSLTNSLGKPLKAWSVDLLPYQEGSGDPSPSNVRPIHGTDKLTITTAGKNLITPIDVTRTLYTCTIEANATEQTIKVTGTATGSGGRLIRLTDIITLPAGMYYISTYGQRSASLAVSNADTNASIATANSSFTLTQTTRVFCGVNVSRDVTYDDSFTIMMSVGSTAPSDYTPYLTPSQTVLTLPQTVYTGFIGSEGGESRSAKYVFTGNETWGYFGGENTFFYVTIPELAQPDTSTWLDATTENGLILRINTASGQLRCYMSSNPFLTEESDMHDYAYSGIGFIYSLITPQTFTLTTPTIPTPTGTATTWATAEDGTVESMEVTYVGKA